MDIEKMQLDLANANEELEKQRQEIAELKSKLNFADAHFASHIAVFTGDEFERKIAALRKDKDAVLPNSSGDRAILSAELTAWEDALKILLKHTGKESTTVKALAKSLKEKPADPRERAKMEEIIATLISMIPEFPANTPYKAAELIRFNADSKGIPCPSIVTVKKYLVAAQDRAARGSKILD